MKQKTKKTPLKKREYRFTLIFTAIGIVMLLGTLLFGIKYSRQDAQTTMDKNISDLKKQINDYNDFLALDEVKSLVRLTDKAEDISKTLDMLDESKRQEYIESIFNSQRLSCIFVLDKNLNMVEGCFAEGESYEDWNTETISSALAGVLEHPKKLYAARIHSGGNAACDIAVVARTDAQGVVFCAALQTDEALELNYSAVRNLMARNETRLKGTLCIAENGKIIATNQDLSYTDVDDIPELLALESLNAGSKLTRFVSNGSAFYGGIVKCRSYDIYAFYPASAVYTACRTIMLVAIVLFILIFFVISLLNFKSRESHAREINRQHEEYQEKLEAAVQSEQRANQSKTDFLRRISHDIRTPINVILGMLEIGNRNPTNTELLADCRAKEQTAAEYLLELVNDILTLNRADGKKPDSPQTSEVFRLQDEVQKVYLLAAAQIKDEDGVELEPPQFSGEDRPLVGESLYLRQIMMNIITNAMRYSKPGGSVRVFVSQIPAQNRDGRAEVRFVCEDNGIGMSSEFQKTMFEPFAQENTGSVSSFEGVGLGLSIVQKLVNRLNGTIEVESKQGSGTHFVITIPYQYADMSENAEAQGVEGASPDGLTVLIVEDNELNMEIAEFMVKEAGANVIKAADGAQAVEKFAASAPGGIDMILTDVIMPEMDGIEETRRIRAFDRPDAKTVPIIAMTANLFKEDILEYTNVGMTDVLPKPLNIIQLTEMMGKYITKEGKTNG